MSLECRLRKLEAQLQASQSSYSSDVEAARMRAAARIRLKIGEALDAAGHPAVISARTFLIRDTPAQAAADLETLTRWHACHPVTLDPDEDRLTRIMQKLEEMARRLQAAKGVA